MATNKLTYIYFIQNTVSGKIKIGRSINPVQRLNSLQSASGTTYTLLYYFMGTMEIENDLHRLFDDFRAQDDWYYPCKALTDYIALMQDEV